MAVRIGTLTDSSLIACRIPDFIVATALADSRLVAVLDAFRPEGFTVHAVYPQYRQSSLLVRAFSDFLVERFSAVDV
ncbi:MAG: LysR substrate-binding domain-containing protein [Rhodanobacter sp.]